MFVPSAAQLLGLKGGLFLLCLAPAARLGWRALQGGLGANPVEVVTRAAGWWTLAMLMLTLSVTPLRRLSGWNWLLRLRRMLGLFAFSYGTAHLTTYLWLDQFFDWPEIVKDVFKRPFITVGMLAMLLMAPLAMTSTNAMVKRMGARRWQGLHRLIYVIAPLGVLHYWWLVKRDISEPAVFLGVLAALLGARVVVSVRGASLTRRPVQRATHTKGSSDRCARIASQSDTGEWHGGR